VGRRGEATAVGRREGTSGEARGSAGGEDDMRE
jgi:hypothetical protein